MLFNSYSFIFLFFPIVLIIFFIIGRWGHDRAAIAWLIIASLFFYGWFNAAYLVLILGSVFFNYVLGMVLFRRSVSRKILLIFGITVNSLVLVYFKYCNFFIENINSIVGSQFHFNYIILPLAISFFTFQQIAYLVDIYRGKAEQCSFLNYCLFITFFPKLIAGPIVRYKEFVPQLSESTLYRFNSEKLSVGLTIFFVGLFKKVVIADGVAVYADRVFFAAAGGNVITFFEAWGGALSYTFQLYFDFSGYTDMAIGLGGMFGILIPMNFYSPYKAVNIIDFWQRWHITLSRFLRDYLYIPLGGNRKGAIRQYINLMITMLIGGLWHGAGWTFVAWGALHGLFLIINHAWRTFRKSFGQDTNRSTRLGRGLSQIITFAVVAIAWVFFRADSFDSGTGIIQGMIGANGIALHEVWVDNLGVFGHILTGMGLKSEHILISKSESIYLLLLLLIVCFSPNTHQVMSKFKSTFDTFHGRYQEYDYDWQWIKWKPTFGWAVYSALVAASSIMFLNRVSDYLYFQF